jgi:hypothetical protein
MGRKQWGQVVRQLLDVAAGRGRGRGRGPAGRRPSVRPYLEGLETRLAPAITLSVANPQPFPEGDSGTTNMVFVVTRSGDTEPAVQVNYATQDGTGPNGAHAGTDYEATSGTLSFGTGETVKNIAVPIIGNTLLQSDRTFTVALSNPLPSAAFAAQQTFAAGSGPGSVAVGDFNGDFKPDLAVANSGLGPGSGTVSVLLNTTAAGAPSPSFAAQQTFATGHGPQSVAVGDVNGDGKPDLAVANSGSYGSGTVSVLLNTTEAGAPSPSFAAQQTFATGSRPFSVAVGDFNGDGKPDLPDVNGDGQPDLAVANFGSGTVSVLLNNVVPITLSGSPATGTIQDDDAPASMAVAAGNNQSATVNTAFATNLAVDVRNAAGQLVQGVSVTFTAPSSGPGGSFSILC